MAAWFQKREAVPRRHFRPGDLTYPFAFPVVTSADDEDVVAYGSAEHFGTLDEASVREARAPRLEIFTNEMRVWTPVRIISVCDREVRLFGRRMFHGEFEYAVGAGFELVDLKTRVIACVRADPDDLWNQVADHDDVIKAVTRAESFAELARVIAEVGGHGSWA